MVFTSLSFAAACPRPTGRRGALAIASVALAAGGAVAGLAGTAVATPVTATAAHAAAAASTDSASTAHSASATPRGATSAHHATYSEKAAEWQAESRDVIAWARKQRGKPYQYGGDGPNSFDCSGLVRYVFLHAIHRSLPHNAAEQYHSIRHIRHRDLQPGDLVFVDNGGYISHVGIFAGHGWWWVAPHTGTRVHKQRIYHAHMLYGRAIPWPHN